MKSDTFPMRAALIKEEMVLLRQLVFGNPKNCELAERDARHKRQMALAYSILSLPEIVRFIINLFSF